jgi:hypothetical protein
MLRNQPIQLDGGFGKLLIEIGPYQRQRFSRSFDSESGRRQIQDADAAALN